MGRGSLHVHAEEVKYLFLTSVFGGECGGWNHHWLSYFLLLHAISKIVNSTIKKKTSIKNITDELKIIQVSTKIDKYWHR